jgi:hypothetical protein
MIIRIVRIRTMVALTSATAWLLLAGCGGGAGSTAAPAANPTIQTLIWDSGQWDNSTWS